MEIERERSASSDAIGYFNFAKGVGIIGVLLGHSIMLLYPLAFTDKPFGNMSSILGGGFMAMFFMISGYGFHSRRMKKCVKTQVKLLLIPYWITVVCVIGAKLVLAFLHQRSFWQYGGQYIFSYLFAVNRGVDGGYSGTILGLKVDNVAMLWFFWALFGGWIIYNAITKIKSSRLQYFLVVACICISIGMTYMSKIWPFVFPQMLQAVGFLCAGHVIREQRLLEQRLSPVWYIGAGGLATVSIIWGGADMYTCVWKLGLLDYVGIASIGFLYMRFFAWFAEKRKWQTVYNFISNIGTHTQLILCIHAFDEKVIPWSRLEPFFEGRYWLGCIGYFVIRCAFVFCAYKVICFIETNFLRKRRRKRARIQLNIE